MTSNLEEENFYPWFFIHVLIVTFSELALRHFGLDIVITLFGHLKSHKRSKLYRAFDIIFATDLKDNLPRCWHIISPNSLQVQTSHYWLTDWKEGGLT